MTDPSEDPSSEESSLGAGGQPMRNYTVLPICPRPAVAVTTVTLPVLARRRLVISRFLHAFNFGAIFVSTKLRTKRFCLIIVFLLHSKHVLSKPNHNLNLTQPELG